MRLSVLTTVIAVLGMTPISAQETISDTLEISGQLRFRGDVRDVNGVTDVLDAQSGQNVRLRLSFATSIDEYNKVVFDLQNILGEPGGVFGGTTNVDGLGRGNTVHQAYADMSQLFNDTFDLRIGRMELQYGNQRMISPLDWSSTGRAWDGLLISRESADYSADIIISQAVLGQGASDADDSLAGVYYQRKIGDIDFDAYVFRRHTGIGWSDNTLGVLAEGTELDVDWSFEFAMQDGEHGGGQNAGGSALAIRADMDLQDGLTVGIGYELATGVDGSDDAFRPLYNNDHGYQGHQDIVTWSNLQDLVLRAKFQLASNWNAHADLHLLSKAEDTDQIYFGGGAGDNPEHVNGEGDIGTEFDLYLTGTLSPRVDAWFGISSFTAGDAILNGEDQSWIFAQVVFNF